MFDGVLAGVEIDFWEGVEGGEAEEEDGDGDGEGEELLMCFLQTPPPTFFYFGFLGSFSYLVCR